MCCPWAVISPIFIDQEIKILRSIISLCVCVIVSPSTLGIDWNTPQSRPISDLLDSQLTLIRRTH